MILRQKNIYDKVLGNFNNKNLNEMIYSDNKNPDENLIWDLILY